MGIETKPLIAIDMDDVLCQTNASVAEWHNETYGTNMNLDRFYCKSRPIITYEMHIFTSPMARLPLLEGMTEIFLKRFSDYHFLTTPPPDYPRIPTGEPPSKCFRRYQSFIVPLALLTLHPFPELRKLFKASGMWAID